jgi:hypothetical protein
MALAESIVAKLSHASSATAALIGSGDDCRIRMDKAPSAPAVPYVVFTLVASVANTTHDASSDHDLADVQFSAIASTAAAARNLRKAIRSDLSDVALTAGEKAVEFIERTGFSEATDQFVALLDVSFWHNPLA